MEPIRFPRVTSPSTLLRRLTVRSATAEAPLGAPAENPLSPSSAISAPVISPASIALAPPSELVPAGPGQGHPLEKLVSAYHAISSTLEPAQVAGILAERTVDLFGVSGVAVLLADEQQWLGVAAARGLSGSFLAALAGPVEQGVVSLAIAEGRSLATWDMRSHSDARLAEAAKRDHIVSSACAPLLFSGQTVGILYIYCNDFRRFTEEEFHLLSLLAAQGAIALTNAHAYHELQAQATEIKAGFQRVGEALSASLDVAETLRIILQQSVSMTRADAGAIYMLCDPHEGAGLRLAEMRGIDRRSVRRFRVAAVSQVARMAMQERRAVIVTDTRRVTDIAFPTLRLSLDETAETRSVICVPLIIGDRALGVLEQYGSTTGAFAQRDAELLVAFAHQAAVAVENARLYAQECSIAETLQKAFLPELPTNITGFEIGRVYSPGSRVSAVGGDTYDVFTLQDGRIAALIADVSGQGTYAATQAIMAKYTVRAYALENPHPSSVLSRMNDALVEQTTDSTFLTCCFALIDPKSRRVTLASAAHPPALHCQANSRCCHAVGTEPGLIAGFLHKQDYPTQEIRMAPGDVLVMYTDGVIEARRHKTLFAQERLVRVIQENVHLSAQEIAAAIYAAVTDYVDNDRQDDLALLVLKAV
ncbi:MAG: SpoIIE family protein phosphatase [Capsulimonadales bacterium]|nr:SpoIIE family protein phosphatase [Capsulimonadales bacterium]